MAPRKTATKPLVAEDTDNGVLVLSSGKGSSDREHFMTVDGEEYTLPVKVSPSLSLKVAKVIRTLGDSAGSAYAMEQLLGSKQYDSLVEKDLSVEQWQQIIELIVKRALGPLEKR